MTQEETNHWYVLRCFYGKELVLRSQVEVDFNVETFVPLEKVRQRDRHGRFVWIDRCALTGYVFVHTNKDTLAKIKASIMNTKVMICKDEQGLWIPVIINDKNMADFIRVSGTKEQQALYLDPSKLNFKPGDRVRVIGGTFMGLEGYFVQVGGRHEKRVVVRLDRLIAVATEAIPAALVEKIKE